MKHLVIRNFGPISEVDVQLKRVNVILGPQSSGKSTVLKVACFCDWMERQIEITQKPWKFCQREVIMENLIRFHRMDGYICDDTFIRYENDALFFSYSEKTRKFEFDWKGKKRWNYKRTKIAYIPAERNLLAAIPNWYQVSLGQDNILDFLKEWEFARKYFTKGSQILDLPFSYRYDPTTRIDRIVLSKEKELPLMNVSSGLQSITPLYIMISYLTGLYFKNDQSKVEEYVMRDALTDLVKKEMPELSKEEQLEIVDGILKPYKSSLYIEEPESHIFPSTQKQFVYSLISMLNGKPRHNCFIATHSPYIMTSLNNLILAADKIKESKEVANKVYERILNRQSIRFEEVAAFEMRDGKIQSIMDEEYRMISAEALDKASEEIGDDYNYLLSL